MLIDWIFEIGEKLKQRSLTIHLAVAYLDILMHQPSFDQTQQDVQALTCLLLASKFDELDDNIPLIREFQRIAKTKDFTYEDVTKCEVHLLRLLCWDLFKLTPLHFVQNVLGQGVVFSNDKSFGPTSIHD